MRSPFGTRILAGLVAALATAGMAEAAGPLRCPPPAALCAGGHGCIHAHSHNDIPCAKFAQADLCQPLPPISFSRYANNGEYDCTRHVYGDACPRCPWFWYAYRQPYPVSHEAGTRSEQGRRGGAGRGVGL